MIWLGLAFVAMFAIVYGHVFMGLGGSSRKKMQNRMDRRAAKIDYIRLAREADEARRRKKAEGGSGGEGVDPEKNALQSEDDQKPAS